MTTSKPGPASATWTCVCGERINNFNHTCKQGDSAPSSAAEAAEGTRPAGQAEAPCSECVSGHPCTLCAKLVCYDHAKASRNRHDDGYYCSRACADAEATDGQA